MRTTRRFLVAWTAACCAGCGAPPPSAPSPVPSSHAIAGIVREVSPTEDVAVREAVVRIEDGGSDSGRSVVTDDAGRFEIAGVTVERMTLRISGRGYDDLLVAVSPTEAAGASLDLHLAPTHGVVNEPFSGNVCEPPTASRMFVPRSGGFFRLTSIRTESFEGFRVALTAAGSPVTPVVQRGTDYTINGGVSHEIVVSADPLTCPRGAFRITYLRPE